MAKKKPASKRLQTRGRRAASRKARPSRPRTASRRAARRTPARRAKARPTAKAKAKAPGRARKAAQAKPARRVTRPAARTRRPARPARAAKAARPARPASPKAPAPSKATRPAPAPKLERERRRLADNERLGSDRGVDDRMIAAARSGHDELRAHLREHTETSPTLTAGDVDAKWEDAYAVGDEAPGGDNPTPDQDRVDDIGKALGVEYQDNEELQGGDEIAERDDKRWELDPASSEDWPHKE